MDSWLPEAGVGGGGNGWGWAGQKVLALSGKMNVSGDVTFSVVTVVNTVLHIWK